MRKQSQDQEVTRILIGVTGGSAAGKTTFCESIRRYMAIDGNFKVVSIPLDAFYKSIDKDRINVADYNFDHPNALDFDMAYNVLLKLLKGQKAELPKYCFVTHMRLTETEEVTPSEIIMFEGILALYDQRIRDLMKYKIFIHCDDDVRLCRRVLRDVQERGRKVEGVLFQYNKFVKGAYKDFIYPTIRYADLIVPGSRNNKVSVDFIVRHMKNMTKEIQFYKKAIKAKIYFYGEIIQSFLYSDDNHENKNILNDMTDETVDFIFACTEEQKKELDLFINQITRDAFTFKYFADIYLKQYVRILGDLLTKIVKAIRQQDFKSVELIPYKAIGTMTEFNSDKKFKIVFFPYMDFKTHSHENILHLRKAIPKDCHLIVLNIFCFHLVLKRLTKMRKVTIVNLYCIANDRLLEDALRGNFRDDTHTTNQLVDNPKLIAAAEEILQNLINRNPQVDEVTY